MVTLDLQLLATALGVLGTLLGAGISAGKVLSRLTRVEKQLGDVRGELAVLCRGVCASLDGLRQQGCNGVVTRAHRELTEYLTDRRGEEGK